MHIACSGSLDFARTFKFPSLFPILDYITKCSISDLNNNELKV